MRAECKEKSCDSHMISGSLSCDQLYLKSAFSAPRICTVDEGCLARLSKEPVLKQKAKKLFQKPMNAQGFIYFLSSVDI